VLAEILQCIQDEIDRLDTLENDDRVPVLMTIQFHLCNTLLTSVYEEYDSECEL